MATSLITTLTRKRVLKVSKLLRAKGQKLPRTGFCVTVRDSSGDIYQRQNRGRYMVQVCRDRNGYYSIPGDTDGLFGRAHRRRRR